MAAEEKKSFVMMSDWVTLIANMPVEVAGELITAMCRYQISGELPETDQMVAALLAMIIPVMDSNNAKHQQKCERLASNLEKSRSKSAQIDTEMGIEMDTDRDRNSNRSDGDPDPVPDIKETSPKGEEKKKTAQRMMPPSVEEVSEYCKERKNTVNAQQFVDFYASKGWKVGREPMKDWRAAVRTWEQREKKRRETARSGTKRPQWSEEVKQHDYDFDQLESMLLQN